MNWEAGPPQRGMYQHPDLRLPTLHKLGEDISSAGYHLFLAISLEKPNNDQSIRTSQEPFKHINKHGVVGIGTFGGKTSGGKTRRLKIKEMPETGFTGNVVVSFSIGHFYLFFENLIHVS